MNKRRFIKALLGVAGVGLGAIPTGRTGRNESDDLNGTGPYSPLLIQVSPLAGFQFYEGERLWQTMKPGHRLALRRAPRNKYDQRAVEVWWNDSMIGHLPRFDNAAVSQMMDRGGRLHGVIAAMAESSNPWQRVTLEVWHDPSGFTAASAEPKA